MHCLLTEKLSVGSGKSCTMFGNNCIEDGIVPRSVELILKQKYMNISIVEMIGNDTFDIVSGRKVKISTIGEEGRKEIRSASEFNQMLSKTLEIRSQDSTDQNNTSSRSHLIFNLRSYNSDGNLIFIDLAGWESPKNKKNVEQTKFINSSLTSLTTVFEKIAKKEVPSYDTKLTKFFKPFLTSTSPTFACFIMFPRRI